MFKLSIFSKSNNYNNLEKKCHCCLEKYDKFSLVKDASYFNGKKKICNKCLGYMNDIIEEYTTKYGDFTSSDKNILSNNLPILIKKIFNPITKIE
tara:strand:+ start:80 stop:364 length:285 start_codon:yes stop_codon:yes gene_type:complete